MKKCVYQLLENYMIACMTDSAHDKEHVYRVLYNALSIADAEELVDYDILIAACLLHDIGRKDQFENPGLDHAEAGAEKAYDFLLKNHFSEESASKICGCIRTHRYRSDNPPASIEAKILFDADKLDVTGAIGIARTLLYKGHLSEPLYSLLPDGTVSDGTAFYGRDREPSFFQEYKRKLEKVYSHFYTKEGARMAKERQQAAVQFYNQAFSGEVKGTYESGMEQLAGVLRD